MTAQIASDLFWNDGLYEKLFDASAVSDKLAYTLGQEFFAEYKTFDGLLSQYAGTAAEPTFEYTDIDELNSLVVSAAGRLHMMLAEKLISIRDN